MGLCLRRLVLQYPWRGGRVQAESAAAFKRNQWQPSAGIGGRVRPESVATFARNTQSDASWDNSPSMYALLLRSLSIFLTLGKLLTTLWAARYWSRRRGAHGG